MIRSNKPLLAGYFNAKRKSYQDAWLPCEAEALCIGVSVKFFAPYIIQSNHQTTILTDSKACVQASQKLRKGLFSVSPRISTFLSSLSRYKVDVQHIAGKNNIFVDFASRNPIVCEGPCQVCAFISELEESVVGQVQVSDVLSGKSQVPYNSRQSWLDIQQSCSDLMKVQECLREGLTPARRKINSDVHRYLNCVSLSSSPNDGMVIVRKDDPFQKTPRQRIVIPRHMVHGLVTALHLQLNHPTIYQLELVFSRAFFALDMHTVITQVVKGCHTCAALLKLPSSFKKKVMNRQQNTKEGGKLQSSNLLCPLEK